MAGSGLDDGDGGSGIPVATPTGSWCGRRWWLWWDPGVGDVGGNNGDGDEIYVNPHPSFLVLSLRVKIW
ncbi:hypothetical protein BDA96_05G112900 [Sorghum bicolor]|uniref:Uncharacterized protein n=2 Tax=Sorghum bicolor TaxID=4558 RepID=A0A921QYR7_SORBI|nr:hypothetical protein BDA96_05G112900 [Sorghum bicolor]KAG0529613.1 hypothetical protein BDA96_05G112900 [Sorghum bicolor]OQU83325.1 hypothetical protein SORBI_3005G108225 [Sorghum bicolor]